MIKLKLFWKIYKIWFIRLILLASTSIILLIGYWYFEKQKTEAKIFSDYQLIEVSKNKTKLKLYLADTPKKSTTGLSIVTSLPKNQGMLFTFPQKSYHSFWMKNMKISIDIIFLSDGKITDILENITPESYPQTFTSSVPANQVIEINAGESKSLGLNVGDFIDLTFIK